MAVQPTGDVVRMHETVDVTKVREVRMIDAAIMHKGILLFLKFMMREPFPEERPSLARLTTLLEILWCGGCYVDFRLVGQLPHAHGQDLPLQRPRGWTRQCPHRTGIEKVHQITSIGTLAGTYTNAA